MTMIKVSTFATFQQAYATESACTRKLTSFVISVRKSAMTIELRANFELNKSQNLLIRLERQSMITMNRKQPSTIFKALNVLYMPKYDFSVKLITSVQVARKISCKFFNIR